MFNLSIMLTTILQPIRPWIRFQTSDGIGIGMFRSHRWSDSSPLSHSWVTAYCCFITQSNFTPHLYTSTQYLIVVSEFQVSSIYTLLSILHNFQLSSQHSYFKYEATFFLLITTMETTASETESSMPTPLRPEPPVRILVQTLTHLIPGNDYFERNDFILNRMCQYHWSCDFSVPKFRWASYNDQFAFDNQRCFFLVDYGKSQNDDDVPVLSYEWTGESL